MSIKSFLHEFREFAAKGNVMDLAIGVVIGGAFGKITASLVGDVLMPPLGMLLGRVDFKMLHLTLKEATATSPAVTLNYGNFINEIINFIIVAFALFMMIKVINRLKRLQKAKDAAEAVVAPTRDQELLTEIRDLLKSK